MEKKYRLLVINPGSTSTKISLFENEKELFQKLEQWKNDDPYGPSNTLLDSEEDPTKPWDADQTSLKLVDVQGKAEIVLANGIYVKKDNLKVRMQNRIRRLALYRNPE